MNETCKSCGTVFDLDEKILSDKIHWLKCSVCNEKWSVSLEKNRIISEEKIEKTSINNSHNDEINKVKSELASIKLVVENKSKQMSNINNPILELKNKSVSEIAAELSASKLKTDNLKVIESIEQKKNTNQNNKTKIKKVRLFPLVLVLFFLVTGVSVFFRSPIMSYSYVYFPMLTEKYSKGINSFFNYIKLPIFAELSHIEIIDFGATFQNNDVKFFGILINNTSRPILAPKIKVLAVTEDGKIVVEKIIPITQKILMPSSKIEFYDIVKMNFKKENISVRATILKEIFVY
tara:strand:- start:883 stop:1758 length:876 start_codon:yes stop_codon:yes gene_type:complete